MGRAQPGKYQHVSAHNDRLGPDLEIHLLAVPEWVPALGAAGARRVEVVVVAGLEHLPRYEPADMTGCEPGVNCRNMI